MSKKGRLSASVNGSPQPFHYPIKHYAEELYLNKVHIVATTTIWRFVIEEAVDAIPDAIQVSVSGHFDPLNDSHVVRVPVIICNSLEEYKQKIEDNKKIYEDVPTWEVYQAKSKIEDVNNFLKIFLISKN